jgi:hypothetical protein
MTHSLLGDALILLILAIFASFVLIEVARRRFFAFDPLMFFWAGLFASLVAEVVGSYDDYVFYYDETSVLWALGYTVIGLAFLHLGYHLGYGERWAMRVPTIAPKLMPNMLLLFSLLPMGLGLLGWALEISTAGSLQQWAAVARGGQKYAEESGYVNFMASLLLSGASLLVVHVELHRRNFILKCLGWGMLVFLLIFFLYLGSRSRVIACVGVAFMAWAVPRRRNPSLLIAVPVFLMLNVVVNFQANYRNYFTNFSFNFDQIDWSQVPENVLPRFLTGATGRTRVASRASEFGMTVAVAWLVPDTVPYTYGREFLQLFTQPIPRALWPDKSYPRGEAWSDIHQIAGTSSYWTPDIAKPYLAGPSPGYIASWVYNGGIVGLLIGGLLTGGWFRFVRTIYERSSNCEGFLIIYIILAPTGFGEPTTHPFIWLYSLPLLLAPLTIVLLLMRYREFRQRRRRLGPLGLSSSQSSIERRQELRHKRAI